jgi:hypothetical protein
LVEVSGDRRDHVPSLRTSSRQCARSAADSAALSIRIPEALQTADTGFLPPMYCFDFKLLCNEVHWGLRRCSGRRNIGLTGAAYWYVPRSGILAHTLASNSRRASQQQTLCRLGRAAGSKRPELPVGHIWTFSARTAVVFESLAIVLQKARANRRFD